MVCVGSSGRKRNEDGEVPPMAIACPETDNDLMILRGPIAIRVMCSLKDNP